MSIDRRKFLELAGCSALVFVGKPSLDALAKATQGAPPIGTGRRLAMVIDPRKCLKEDGCTTCIQACHTLHNVPSFPDRAHEVKWIWKEPFEEAFPAQSTEYAAETYKESPVLVLCNHCDNPPCVRVCPTQATWKREEDGIVMMDWHRCIGCRYCVAACPYGSRSFNWLEPRPHMAQLNPAFPTRTRGVVEKCTFCEKRLANGQLPACVEVCPEKALVFGDLHDPRSEVRQLLQAHYTIRRKPELGTSPEVYYIV